jgi:hypothetical protein
LEGCGFQGPEIAPKIKDIHFLAGSETASFPSFSYKTPTMGKSIRSKSKRKFRAIRRRDTYGPVEKKRQFEALSNLRRCVGNQTATRQSVDKLRALVRGEISEMDTVTTGPALPDATDILGLSKYKAEMDEAEQEALHKVNGHFSFKTTAAPDYQIPVLWKTSEQDTRMTQQLLKERELVANGMVLDTTGSSQASKDMARKQKAARKAKSKRRRSNSRKSGCK